MSDSTTTKQKGILSTSMNANGIPNQNSALIEHFPIEGTPFTAVGDYRGEKDKYYMTLGNYKVSEDCEDFKTAREWHTEHFWEVVMVVTVATIEKYNEIKKIKEEIPQG